MRTSRRAGVIAGALTMALACGPWAVAAADPGSGSRGLVKICHRTSSLAHPYELVKVRRDSVHFNQHLQHRAYSDRHGFRDLVDGVDGRIQTLEDCPEWWDLQDRTFKPYKFHRRELRNDQQKQKQKQGQDIHIYLNKKEKAEHRTYRPRAIRPGQKPKMRKLAPRGVRPKGTVRS